MILKRLYLTDPGKGQNGFTFIEVLVAIAIMSFSAFVIWNGLSGVMATGEKTLKKSGSISELALFEYSFRVSVNKINIPYWEKSISSDFLTEFQNELENYSFKYLNIKSFQASEKVMTVILVSDDFIEVEITANYGSFPLVAEL